jgi:hypothetical protein
MSRTGRDRPDGWKDGSKAYALRQCKSLARMHAADEFDSPVLANILSRSDGTLDRDCVLLPLLWLSVPSGDNLDIRIVHVDLSSRRRR